MPKRHSTTGGQHSFAQIPHANIQRSSFDRSCGLKTTFDSGYLVPIFVDEALPGDTMNMKLTTFGRLATPLHPIMDNMYLDTFFFAVPIRLLWENWQKFNGEQTNPGDSTDYLVPIINSEDGFEEQDLFDYFGLPTKVAGLDVSALWARAYNLIYNEWFRDQNMIDSLNVPTFDGPDLKAQYVLQRRGKRHDYFTSCLPWPQKGEAVELPLGGLAPVTASSGADVQGKAGAPATFEIAGVDGYTLQQGPTQQEVQWQPDVPGNDDDAFLSQNTPSAFLPAGQFNLMGAVADLGEATSITINALRESFQIQRMFERDARGGTRYTEILRSHFGVVSPDQRLQRPEYLGGGSQNINVSPVPQTSSTDEDVSPQGNLAAFGTTTGSGHGFTKSFTEHCIIIGLVNVRADLNYQQGLHRMWSRRTRFDFYWPSLAHLGEQAVLQKEIFADGTSQDDDVFGYQERFAEYRYKPSNITGRMRSNADQPLDTWHLAQDFENPPALNETFINDNPPIERILAVQTEPQFLLDCFFKYRCARPMPTYSVPGMIDHF